MSTIKTHFGDTGLGVAIGVAIVILAFSLGFGGCMHIAHQPATAELQVTNSFNARE